MGESRRIDIACARKLFCKLARKEGIATVQIAQELNRTRAAVHYLTTYSKSNGNWTNGANGHNDDGRKALDGEQGS